MMVICRQLEVTRQSTTDLSPKHVKGRSARFSTAAGTDGKRIGVAAIIKFSTYRANSMLKLPCN